MKTTTSLTTFIKDQCANYMEHYDNCVLDDEPCDVLCGKQCGYFERYVRGPADYPYRIPGYDYAKLFAEYAEITKTPVGKVAQRRCECGEPLTLRQRVCTKCRIQRRRESYRESKRLKRSGNFEGVHS